MNWIAPSEKDAATDVLEKRRWDNADPFRANSGLKSQEYSAPVLGLEGDIRAILKKLLVRKGHASGTHYILSNRGKH